MRPLCDIAVQFYRNHFVRNIVLEETGLERIFIPGKEKYGFDSFDSGFLGNGVT